MTDALDLRLAYAILLCCVALQRVIELWISRRHLRARAEAHARDAASASTPLATAGTRADWWAMIGVHAALIVLPACEVFWFDPQALARAQAPQLARFWIALAAYVAAQLLRAWSIASLGPAWNARAAVDASLGVVARGPYRWIRHPNYLAVLIDFSAVPLAGGAWRSWIVLNALHLPILVRRIRLEERLLARVDGYTSLMSGKGRFLPRLRATSRAHAHDSSKPEAPRAQR